MKLSFLILAFLGCICELSSQSNPETEKANNAFNKPPVNIMSPEAASLGKYGTYNVNHYSGSANINIPVYELKESGLTIPISINYDGSGYIPNKNSGVVGQDWSLSAGGVITRVVKGVPDEKHDPNPGSSSSADQYSKEHTGYIYGINQTPNNQLPTQTSIENLSFLATTFPGDPGFPISNLNCEYNPDIFSFNFLGHSGTFVMGNDKIIKVSSDRNYKVDISELKEQYDLGDKISQKALNYIVNPSGNDHINNYIFSRITLTADDGYKFIFGGTLSSLEVSFRYIQGANDNLSSRGVEGTSGVISAWYLTKIIAPDGDEIIFDYGTYTGPQDPGPNEVNVLLKLNSNNAGNWDQVTAAFLDIRFAWIDHKVYYSLYNSNGSTAGVKIEKSLIKMAYLKKIETKLKTISFSYSLRNQFGQNKFYTNYAGKQFETYANFNQRYFTSKLDKITIQDKIGIARPLHDEDDFLGAPWLLYDFSYQFYGGQSEGNRLFLKELKTGNTIYKFDYYRTGELVHPMTPGIDKWGFYNGQNGNLRFVGVDGVPVYGDPNEFETNFTYSGQVRTPDPAVANIGRLQKITYPTGGETSFEYEGHVFKKLLKRKVNSASGNSIIPEWVNLAQEENAGGCRIKKIINNPGTATEYKYIKNYNQNPTGPSSGLLTDYGVFRVRLNRTNGQFHDQVFDQNIAKSNGFSESHICYSQVAEILGNGSEGYTVYTYSNPDTEDYPTTATPDNYYLGPTSIFLYSDVPAGNTILSNQMKRLTRHSSRSVERGKILRKEVYGNSNSLLISEEYKYNISTARFDEKTVGYERIYNQKYPDQISTHGFSFFFTAFQIYHYHNNLSQLIQKTFANGQVLTQTTDYTYKSNSNPLVTQKTVTRSDGSVFSTKYYYPEDRIGFPEFPASSAMISANMVSTVLEEETYKNSTLLQTQKTIYSDVIGNGRGFQPVKVYTINSTIVNAPLEERVNYAYYPDGKLKEFNKRDDAKSLFLWDYKRTYPVAEVKNAGSIDDISYTSFETTESGNQGGNQWVYTQSATVLKNPCPTGSKAYNLGSFTNQISRSNLNNAIQYILSFWHKGASVSVGSFSPVNGEIINGWTYKEYLVTGVTSVNITGEGFVDELRLYPKGAFMTTYAYQPLFGIMSQSDVNNKTSNYTYDQHGRLLLIIDKNKNIIKKICYNYFGQPISCSESYFRSSALSQTFIKNDCLEGYEGTSVVYSVPAERYISNIDLTDANAQAQAEINYYGQAYANANGTCICTINSCSGIDKKCVSGVCETGVKKYLSSTYSKTTGLWTCVYIYEFSDCSQSQQYSETNTSACTVGATCGD